MPLASKRINKILRAKAKGLTSRANKRGLYYFGLLVCIISLFLVFKPVFYANVDEHNYLRSAWKLAHQEHLTETDPNQALGGFVNHQDLYISKYNIGASLWLAPFTLLGWQAVFYSGMLLLIFLLYLGKLVLNKLDLSPYWLGLFILFPPFIYFNRTLFAELPAAILILLSYWAYLNREKTWGLLVLGFSLGAMVLVRYNLALWVILLLLNLAWEYRHQPKILVKNWLLVGLTSVPFLIIFLYLNQTLYGSMMASGYRFSGEESLVLSNLPERLPWYLLLLNFIYPGQFVLSLASHKPLALTTGLFNLLTILFYSLAGGFLFEKQLVDPLIGVRFFIPIMPVVLLHYFAFWQQQYQKLKFSWTKLQINHLLIGISLLLVSLAGALNYQHQQFLKERYQTWQVLNSYVTTNTLFLGDVEDYIYFSEALNRDFNSSGYNNYQNYRPSPSKKTYLLEIGYNSRPDRPTTEVVQWRQSQSSQLIKSSAKLKIYELEN